MSSENLYREMLEAEEGEDLRNRQNLAPKALGVFKPRQVDHDKAMMLFKTEIAPVIERRKKALSSKAYRMFLKLTGNWKGMEEKDVVLVDPTRGPVPTGLSESEILEEIARDPTKFKTGNLAAPPTGHVAAERRTIEPKWTEDEGK